MRSDWTLAVLAAACAVACAPSSPQPVEQRAAPAQSQSPIAYGSSDTVHTAVVALLANSGGGSFTECSGTIVQVKNGRVYVLTAAHCCNTVEPTLVVEGSDYSVGESYLFGGTPAPPAYSVVPGSVAYDPAYNQTDHDFCMLQYAKTASTPTIALPSTSSDGLSLGTVIEYVGYGVTDSNQNNSTRRYGDGSLNQGLDASTLTSSQGGAQHVPGSCEGDSGGPVLIPAGVPQSQQTLVGVISYGNSTNCASNTISVASRVISEIGASRFITEYLNDALPDAGSGSSANCNACAQAAMGAGASCAAPTQACQNDANCISLNNCDNTCAAGDAACEQACFAPYSAQVANLFGSFTACLCYQACPTQCASICAVTCGHPASDTSCAACLDSNCCGLSVACAADAACASCMAQGLGGTCAGNAHFQALNQCLNASCASACSLGGATSGSTGSTGSTSGSASTSSSSSASSTQGTTSAGSTGTSSAGSSSGAGSTGTSAASTASGATSSAGSIASSTSTSTAAASSSSTSAGSTGAAGTTGGGHVCAPGQSIACVGPGGCAGGQACKSDGSGYEACDCGSGTNTSSSAGASTGSSAGSTGAGSSGSTGSTSGARSGGCGCGPGGVAFDLSWLPLLLAALRRGRRSPAGS